MTRGLAAQAPGKLVVSGAYSVLEGAPAIVTAVDRYAIADAGRPADFVTEEMREGMRPPYPLIDASALRDGEHKLGLGSSAALLVAALAATGEFEFERPEELSRLFERALAAHRRAQGGGSGIDVAASTFGGTLEYQLPAPLRTSAGLGPPHIRPLRLPPDVQIEVWRSPRAASTRHFISSVYQWRDRDQATFESLFDRLRRGAEDAVAACRRAAGPDFLSAVAAQAAGLAELGGHAGLTIIEPSIASLHASAQVLGACVVPAGAGGGDVNLLLSIGPAPNELREKATDAGLSAIPMRLAAPGVHAIAENDRFRDNALPPR